MVVVIMFEPAHRGEDLTPVDQVNQVFGPFGSDEEAEAWTSRMVSVYERSRTWLIIPVDNPNVVM